MDQKEIYKLCKNVGCCDACCLRYLGIKSPKAFVNISDSLSKFEDNSQPGTDGIPPDNIDTDNINVTTGNENKNNLDNKENTTNIIQDETSNGVETPPNKKRKPNVCATCLGLLQEDNWLESYEMIKETLDKRGYESKTFACGLSAPIATMLRDKSMILHITDKIPSYDSKSVTPLKEAWKWSFGVKLGVYIDKKLDSGAISPLLVTVNMDYVDDLQELEILKTVSPELFEERSKQKRRFVTEFTRRCVEQALEKCTLEAAREALKAIGARARCVSVICAHAPVYLGGRYLKLGRNLPQSPWVLEGKRVLPSSVQEIIFGPLVKFYKFDNEEADRKFKFIAAGREDVDVRCLGDGRPFAIEVTDPTRHLTQEELTEACKKISDSGEVIVKSLVHITKEDLVQLKKGEETKSKSYEALCIKLSHSEDDVVEPDSPVKVTEQDIDRINTYTNTKNEEVRISIQQKTPIRVLHRRPLLTRTREILDLSAKLVPGHPQLFTISIQTSAGTYVKEWCHGELARSTPSLCEAMRAKVDMLALDVTAVHLQWPPA